jgi:hypothetical protein
MHEGAEQSNIIELLNKNPVYMQSLSSMAQLSDEELLKELKAGN